ncbi:MULTISPECIES: adenylate/guanylate cyclase domain-containing protein [Legionella]|uniref:Guanylate cyclase n=1 Tax=Legionella maceachernii TaxID=466 RepID=A0A0W0VY96_9GAMM|nr:adenylate/guanylate cyclase domain-containing protein [Legionella maceachernii]KTD24878.1 guanylate cyclase [Legionella maceachernii]SKA15797.1 adenylate cyclase [Legionella maceachernii]SUP01556.1 Adenylate cyclase 1 [Legionella maceachernii]
MQTPLELEILKSEKLRATILTAVFIFLALMWGLFTAFSPQKTPLFLPIYLGSIAVYFLLTRKMIDQYTHYQKNIPLFLRYLTTFIEISIPTLAIILLSDYVMLNYIFLMSPLLIYAIFIFLSSLTLNEWLCRFAGIVAAFEYGGLTYYLLYSTHFIEVHSLKIEWFTLFVRSVTLFICGLVTAFITSRIKTQLTVAFEAQIERDRIASIFGQHVSPEVVTKLLSKNTNATESLPVCIMFLDLRNFTLFSEQNDASTVVNYLNHFFRYAIDIVHENKGIINKFLGDGFMAIFGAPISSNNDVANAVHAALAIVKRNEEEIKKGELPPMKLGIGLHFGYAVTGIIGNQRRVEYTIIGDVVNSAAHIEQLNKLYHTTVLISEDALNKVPEINAEFLGNAFLKHRKRPIKLYKLL